MAKKLTFFTKTIAWSKQTSMSFSSPKIPCIKKLKIKQKAELKSYFKEAQPAKNIENLKIDALSEQNKHNNDDTSQIKLIANGLNHWDDYLGS